MNEATLEVVLPTGPNSVSTSALAQKQRISLYGREVNVELSSRALRAIEQLEQPVVVEMELFFSCLVRKRVLIKPLAEASVPLSEMTPIHDRMHLSFRPVVSEQCRIDDLGENAPPLKTMPVKKKGTYVPRWLTLDFQHGQWSGEYGF